jgi:SAM-dependent methyltransferase
VNVQSLSGFDESRIGREAVASLTALQAQQIWKQVRVQFDSAEGEEIALTDFVVSLRYHSHVMRPYSSREMAFWISRNSPKMEGKRVLDMGCGTGIQGIAALKAGAHHVDFVDLVGEAVEISRGNVQGNIGDQGSADFIRSDLFDSISDSKKYDVILFAQPYFSGNPIREMPCTFGMLMPESSIERFMREAHDFLEPGGRLLMQSWDFGSPENDPRLLAGRFGWQLEERCRLDSIVQPIQQGVFELAILTH